MITSLHTWTRALGRPAMAVRVLEACLMLSLVTVTLGERSWIAVQRRLMPAGDVFNFQSIARNIRHGQYPMQEKRLPGYPLALLIGMELGADPTTTGVAISVLSSGATTLVLYLLGRAYGFSKVPLALVLLLTSVSPLLTVNGVRPLADSFFIFLMVLGIFLVTIAKPRHLQAFVTGIALTLLAFTRYEGAGLAILLLVLLRLRIPWRLVALAASPLIVAAILWIPVAKHIHGSLREFAYFREARESDVGKIGKIPHEYQRIIESAGWGEIRAARGIFSQQKEERTAARTHLRSWSWVLSALGAIGILWMILRVRWRALPFFGSLLLYPIFPAWWFVYSRYVAPVTALYLFSVAAGASACWALCRYFLRGTPALVRGIAYVGLTTALTALILGAAPKMFAEAKARAFERNGSGYAQYAALKSLANRPERVAVAADSLMATTLLGTVTAPADALNAGRGIYLSKKPEASSEELADDLREYHVEILVDTGEKNVEDLVTILRQRGVIRDTVHFQARQSDGTDDTARLHVLDWLQEIRP